MVDLENVNTFVLTPRDGFWILRNDGAGTEISPTADPRFQHGQGNYPASGAARRHGHDGVRNESCAARRGDSVSGACCGLRKQRCPGFPTRGTQFTALVTDAGGAALGSPRATIDHALAIPRELCRRNGRVWLRTLSGSSARMDTHCRAIGRTGLCNDAAESAIAPVDALTTTVPIPQYLHRFDDRPAPVAMAPLTQSDLRRLFELLNDELRASGTEAELFLVGGAVMCLAYDVRPSTQDVDAVFRPAVQVREAAARVGARAGLRPDWLNDGVKGFMSGQGDFAPFLELDHLRVMLAEPAYLLSMKCMAMRLGAE